MTSTMQRAPAEKRADRQSGTYLFLGIALTVLGFLSIAFSVLSTIGTIVFIGALLIAAGVGECIYAVRRRRDTVLNILTGLLYLSVGGILLSNPVVGALSVTLVICCYLFAAGIFRCAYAIRYRMSGRSGLFLSGGIVDIIMGFLIAFGFPSTSLWVIGLFVGIEMLMAGIGYVALSGDNDEIRQAII